MVYSLLWDNMVHLVYSLLWSIPYYGISHVMVYSLFMGNAGCIPSTLLGYLELSFSIPSLQEPATGGLVSWNCEH